MSTKDPVNWMLSEAIDSLPRAERLRQQFFNLQSVAGAREASWEPA
jgi:HSP20 family protein